MAPRGQKDLSHLTSVRERPATGMLSTFAPPLITTICTLREAHPGWGALTLRTELAQELPADALPSRSTIARYLAQEGLTREYERHQALPTPTPPSAQAAHEQWELDAQGYVHVPQVGVIALINLVDRFSKVKLMSYPCWVGAGRASRHSTTADYQLVLRLTAHRWGLCDRLYVDRDSIFYDNGSPSPFPTHLHTWLLALDVELVIGPAHVPTQRAMIERTHQTWTAQVLTGQEYANWEALYLALDHRRDFLNEQLPCASTDNQPPLVAHPEARQPRRQYRPECEAQLLDPQRVMTYLAQGRWFRKASNVGAVSLGDECYSLGPAWRKREVEITFNPSTQQFVFYAPQGELHACHPIQELSKEALMGELEPLVTLHHFQLMLPLTWDEWRVSRLCETF